MRPNRLPSHSGIIRGRTRTDERGSSLDRFGNLSSPHSLRWRGGGSGLHSRAPPLGLAHTPSYGIACAIPRYEGRGGMTALSTESRELLLTAFQGAGYRVYDTVPAVPKPPAIVVSPDSPWIRPNRIGSNLNYECRWKILIVISPRQNAAATLDTENAVDTILGLIPTSFQCQGVNAPQLQDIGAQGTILTTEINVSASMKE
jgi:hypothetical protein